MSEGIYEGKKDAGMDGKLRAKLTNNDEKEEEKNNENCEKIKTK